MRLSLHNNKKSMVIFIGIICVIFSLIGCGGGPKTQGLYPKDYSEIQAVPKPRLTLASGDIIEIKFTFANQFDETVTVTPDGKIQLKLIGDLTVAGKTPGELREELRELYAGQLKYPDIAVIVRSLEDRRVYVGGEVHNPGQIPMPGKLTALEAIMHAGGFDPTRAKTKDIIVIRHKDGQRFGYKIDYRKALAGEIDKPFFLEPFDIVWVPTTTIVKVNQWIDQYINRVIPQTGFHYSQTVGDGSVGVSIDSADMGWE